MTQIPSDVPHILLVDDNPDQLRLLVHALRAQAYNITIAFDGAQGYARAVAIKPDLILLDVQMPKKDGFAAARLLEADPATQHIPVLFLSALQDMQKRLTGLRTGAVDYILKPFDPEEVVERVRIRLALARERSNAAAANNRSPAGPASGGSEVSEGELNIKPSASSAELALFRAGERLVRKRLDSPPRAKDIAVLLGVSERSIAHAFEACLGMTLFEFVRRARMDKAVDLLVHTSLSVVDIADHLGYSSAANFSTAFRDYAGTTPTTYRSAHKA